MGTHHDQRHQDSQRGRGAGACPHRQRNDSEKRYQEVHQELAYHESLHGEERHDWQPDVSSQYDSYNRLCVHACRFEGICV